MKLTKKRKEKFAKEILYYIASERENKVEADIVYNWQTSRDNMSENRFYLYTGNINYLVDFTTAYKEFIQDTIDFLKNQFNWINKIQKISVEKQCIELNVNDNKVEIYIDDEFLKCEFEED